MNREPATYASCFTNRYGEEWEFAYFQSKREGVLRGSDVDWQRYKVIDGHAQGLILNDEEIQWLRRSWGEATHSERQGKQ
jgi:hypothetical protein